MKFLLSFLLFFVLARLYNRWLEYWARKRQLPNAPSMRQLAWQSQLQDFRPIPIDDRWREQPCTNFNEPPTAMLKSDMLRCHVWQSGDSVEPGVTTIIVWHKGLEFPWTMLFIGDQLILASIGDSQGSRFSLREFTAKERGHLGTFLANIRSHLNAGF